MTSNIKANISIKVGEPSVDASIFKINLINDNQRTQELCSEINQCTGANIGNFQAWVFCDG